METGGNFLVPGPFIAIDLKSFYASVECVERGLDPLTTNLLVADETRSDATICLAVSPSLKALGVPGRPRLFEAKQRPTTIITIITTAPLPRRSPSSTRCGCRTGWGTRHAPSIG